MRTILLCALSVLAGCTSLHADIKGPAGPVPVGTPVILTSTADATILIWDCQAAKSQYRMFDGGKTLAFWAPRAGSYRFVLFAATLDPDAKPVGELFEFFVTVQGTQPNPTPTPNPTPGPRPKPTEPTFPDSPLGLSLAVYEAAKSVPHAATDAGQMADAFFGIAARIAAGTLSGRKSIVGQTQIATQAVARTATRTKEWQPVLQAALAKELARLDKAGQLDTDRAIQAAWFELGIGLKAVK